MLSHERWTPWREALSVVRTVDETRRVNSLPRLGGSRQIVVALRACRNIDDSEVQGQVAI